MNRYIIRSTKTGYIDECDQYSEAVDLMNFYILDDLVDHWKVVHKRLKKTSSKCSASDAHTIAEAEVKAEYYIEEMKAGNDEK